MTPSEKTLKLTSDIKALLEEIERSNTQITNFINSGQSITRHLETFSDAVTQLGWLNHLRKRANRDIPDYEGWINKAFLDEGAIENIVQTLSNIMTSSLSDDVYANYFQGQEPDEAFGDENTELGEFKVYVPTLEEQEVLGTNEGFVYVIRYGIRWWDQQKGIIAYGWLDPRVAGKIKEMACGI